MSRHGPVEEDDYVDVVHVTDEDVSDAVGLRELTPERWLPISGWEGLYEVSDRGRVRSLDRIVTDRRGRQLTWRGQLRSLVPDDDGYLRVDLWRNMERRRRLVHNLVLETFIGPRPEGMQACHNDGSRDNNFVTNLRWDTRSANTHDTVKHGRHPMSRRTHCNRGHEFTPENTVQRGRGWRSCRECDRTRHRAVAARRKEHRKALAR